MWRACLASLVVVIATGALAEVLTPDEMRGRALAALARGDAAAGLAIADALLERDPADETALAIRSRAERDLGRYRNALEDARAAWRAAETDAEKYRAALLRAQALSSRGNRGMAQLWLRRAADLAPTPAEKGRAIQDYRYVQARNPLDIRLSFQIAPTDNVNGGSTATEVDYLGGTRRPIGTSRALSGIRYAFGADLEFRLGRTRNTEDRVTLGVAHQTYTLSDEAERILDEDLVSIETDPETGEIELIEGAHGIDGGSFAYSALRLGLGRSFTPGPGQGLYDLSVALGKTFYGGDPYTSYVESRAAVTRQIHGGTIAELSLLGRYLERDRGGKEGVRRLAIGTEVTRRVGAGRLILDAGLATSDSAAPAFDYDEARLGIRYAPGAPVLGAVISAGAEISATDFGDFPFLLGAPADDLARRDVTLRASIDAVLPGLSRYGFAPVLSLEAAERRSSAEIYEFDQIGIGIAVRSIF